MNLDKNQLDLFFAFVARHKRFLKLRETSFTASQLEHGVKVSEKAIKAVQATCKSLSLSAAECLEKPSKRAAAVREIRKKASKLSPKQASFILEHFEAFQTAASLLQAPVNIKAAKKPAEFADRYYQPTQHHYR